MKKRMKPNIDHTEFGSITVEGVTFDYDILIRLEGQVKKRKKKLSKEVYGTSHIVSLAEVEDLYEKDAAQIIIGSGQSGLLRLSDEAQAYLEQKKCRLVLLATPQAIAAWNSATGRMIGMFHVTC
jgi:hypothetical protein